MIYFSWNKNLSEEKNDMKIVLCFLCFSLCGWIWMATESVKLRRFRAKTKSETARAGGIITGYESKMINWGRSQVKAYFPVVRFSAGAEEYTVTSQKYYPELRNFPVERPEVGSGVVLFYDPADPAKIHLEIEEQERAGGNFRLGWIIIGVSAVLSIVVGLVMKWF